MSRSFPIILFALTFASGCLSSKWAREDPEYAEKYSTPYPSNDIEKVERLTKQMIDARHVAHKGGYYTQVAYAENPTAGSWEVGGFHYSEPWIEGHAGASVMLGEDVVTFPGANAGFRLQTPTRFAPFAGAGVYVDTTQALWGDEDDDVRSVFAAIYPEVGAHFWLNETWRVTGSLAYYFNTLGRDSDFLFLGVSFAHLNRPGEDDDEACGVAEFSLAEE